MKLFEMGGSFRTYVFTQREGGRREEGERHRNSRRWRRRERRKVVEVDEVEREIEKLEQKKENQRWGDRMIE